MSIMKIPRGNIIELRLAGTLVPSNATIINTEEISLKISSSFRQLMRSESNPLISTLSNIDFLQKLGSGVVSVAGFQVWEKTDPISFSTESIFYMRTSGKEDVIKPMSEVLKLVVPTRSKDAYTLQAPGPTIRDALKQELGETSGIINGVWGHLTSKGNLSLRIGNFIYLSSVIITSAEPTYSMAVDSNGYPVQGSLRLEFQTIDIANTQMIDNLTEIPNGGSTTSV